MVRLNPGVRDRTVRPGAVATSRDAPIQIAVFSAWDRVKATANPQQAITGEAQQNT
jgi:hypothetical protein